MKRQFLSALFCAVLALCLLPATLAAEEDIHYPSKTYDSKTGRWGLSSFAEGGEETVLLPPEYDYISCSDDSYAAARKIITLEDGQVGVIDQSGNFTPAPRNRYFSDIFAESWYNAGVTTCAEKGVMMGTSEGIFSPDENLTIAECLTLALRLYDLRRGGNGSLEKAPTDWGELTLTLSDGTVFHGYGEVYDPFDWDGEDGLYISCQGETTQAQQAWANTRLGPATVTAGGRTIPGSVHTHMGVTDLLLFFVPENAEDRELIQNTYEEDAPGANKWFRDAAYTAKVWGLLDDPGSGFSQLLSWSRSHLDHRATRKEFALALFDAAGTLEKKYNVSAVHDTNQGEPSLLERKENESIYALYEAGILNGIDSFGTLGGDEALTRAQAAVMVARVLDENQRLDKPPQTPSGYDLEVTALRTSFGYYNEQTLDADTCTVFVYDRGGMMHAPYGWITVIFKPGSAAGDGVTLDPPYVWSGASRSPADTMAFSEDGKRFTYSYFFDAPCIDSSLPYTDQRGDPGTYTFTVDLVTGEVSREYRPVDYAGALAHVTRQRVISGGEHSEDSEDRTVVQTIEAPACTVVLTKGLFRDKYDDYILSLVYKPGSALGDGTIRQLTLPSTVLEPGYSLYVPTDRPPDSLTLSEDGRTLTYIYSFDAPFTDGETVYHEAGTYIYTADLSTGEVSTEIDPASQLPYSYKAACDALLHEEGYRCDIYNGNGVMALLRYKPCEQDPALPDLELYLLYEYELPHVRRLTLPSTDILPDGSTPTTFAPERIRFLGNDVFTYTYRFQAPLWNGDTLLHDKGTYTYTVDLSTGKQSVALEDSHERALADLTQNTDKHPFQLERQLETESCTIVLGMTKLIQYHRAVFALVYKDGSSMGAGKVILLPTLSGHGTHDSLTPHQISLNEEGTVLTYSYHFEEDFMATRPPGGFYFLSHPAGTYTYTVDLITGTVNEDFQPL